MSANSGSTARTHRAAQPAQVTLAAEGSRAAGHSVLVWLLTGWALGRVGTRAWAAADRAPAPGLTPVDVCESVQSPPVSVAPRAAWSAHRRNPTGAPAVPGDADADDGAAERALAGAAVPEPVAAAFELVARAAVPGALGGMDAETSLQVVQAAEVVAAHAMAVGMSAVAAVHQEVAEEVTGGQVNLADLPASKRADLVADARSATVDELAAATGLGQGECWRRVSFALASPARSTTAKRLLFAGACSWERAQRVVERTSELPAEVADQIAAELLGSRPDGTPWSQSQFTSRLRRRVLAAQDPADAREAYRRSVADRGAWASLDDDGTGSLTFTGSGEVIAAAMDRIEAYARAFKRAGDPRTLAQLRADVAADLCLRGLIPAASPATGHDDHDDRSEDTGAHDDADSQPGSEPANGHDDRTDDTGAHDDADDSSHGSCRGCCRDDDEPCNGPAGGGDGASAGQTGCLDALAARASAEGLAPELLTQLSAGDRALVADLLDRWGAYRSLHEPGPLGQPPAAHVDVIVPADVLAGSDTGVGHLPGHGPIPAFLARAIATAPDSIWARLVTDPRTGHALERSRDRYHPDPDLREYLLLRDGTSRAPGSTVPADRSDIDHVIAWHTDPDGNPDGGPTTPDNLACLHRHFHQRKTKNHWRYALDPDTAASTWTSLLGRVYTTEPLDYHEHTAMPPSSERPPVTGTPAGPDPASAARDNCTRCHDLDRPCAYHHARRTDRAPRPLPGDTGLRPLHAAPPRRRPRPSLPAPTDDTPPPF